MSKRDEIHAQLQALCSSSARESRLEISVEPIWLLVTASGTRQSLQCQAVSSTRLPASDKLDAEGGMRMRALGWSKGSGQRDWTKEIGASQLDRLADEIVDVFARIYGREPEQAVMHLVHDEVEHPQNPELVRAMTELARDNQNPHKRHRLYNALLNATFLVPLDPDADDDADAGREFLVLERVQERPVFGVFTDWGSLQRWNPRTCAYLPVHGSDLFQMTLDQRVALLEINPRGHTGGQLFAHEVETLARAVGDWKRRNLH